MDKSAVGLGVSSYLAFHLVVLGALSWASGQVFLIPSLFPSIFLLATRRDSIIDVPHRVIYGQFFGILGAYIAVQAVLGGGGTVSHIEPFSMLALRQVLATFVAVFLTTVGMYLTDSQHPPAYATTLIFSLGLLSGLFQIVVFMVSVVVLVGVHEYVGKRSSLWNLPYEYPL